MQITAKTWNEYITRLSRLNQKAGQLMRQYIDTHGTGDTDALITYAAALVTKYGEGSAELACQMYDALAEAANAGVPAAEPAEPADYSEVARMVNATKNQNPANLPNGVSRLVKRAGADTTLKNAVRDGAEWAWVPHGDTCPFCITLASNGWQKASSKVLKGGHAEHIHANCDCEFAIRFDHNTTVAGYDPEKYLKQYRDAGGDINKMRRVNYADNKERINAQKRAAYAARRLREQANRGILDDIMGGYLLVTEQSIEAVQPFTCRVLDEAGQQALARAHRELLQAAAAHPVGTEVACCYGLDMQPLSKIIISGQQGRVRIPDQDVPYIAAHTHPSGLTFSPSDIRRFALRENMRMLTAVGNDGTVYAIEKTAQFDRSGLLALFRDSEIRLAAAKDPKELQEIMQQLLKEAKQYGANFYAGRDR
uniref:VG15 protein n=1 Tax=Gemmiger formicilis TaxID=745368 RepID=UPI003FF022EF